MTTFHTIFTLVFFVTFVLMVLWVYRPGRKQDYQAIGQDVVDEDQGRNETRGNLQ